MCSKLVPLTRSDAMSLHPFSSKSMVAMDAFDCR
jgi:hypothetical protein